MRKPWFSPFLFSSNSKKSRKCSSRVCHCERKGGKLSSHCLIFLNFIYAVAMDKIVLCKKNLRFFKQESILLDFLCFSFSFFLFLRLSVIFPECLCSDGCLDLLCCGELPVILSTRVIYFFFLFCSRKILAGFSAWRVFAVPFPQDSFLDTLRRLLKDSDFTLSQALRISP